MLVEEDRVCLKQDDLALQGPALPLYLFNGRMGLPKDPIDNQALSLYAEASRKERASRGAEGGRLQ